MEKTFSAHLTDLYGGELNYSYKIDFTFCAPADSTDQQLIRAAKKEAGWNGVRTKKIYTGCSTIILVKGTAALVIENTF